MTPAHRTAVRRAVLAWYDPDLRRLPWRGVRDPCAVLVSEVMLQQTQASRVVPKYREFLKRFPTFRALAEAPTAQVIRAWAPLGYNQRAVRLQRIARAVVHDLGGELPRDIESLRRLPGVGGYTASAVACLAFGAQTAVLDTNVRRVLGRVLWGVRPPAESELRQTAEALLPKGRAADWNQALMDLGALVCLARSPRCGECPVRRWCRAAPAFVRRSGLTRSAPRATPERKRQVAAKRGARRPSAEGPFKGSTRYYRGRIVERLRALRDGQTLPLDRLGAAVKPGYSPADAAWLRALVTALARDGLVRVTGGREASSARVSLP